MLTKRTQILFDKDLWNKLVKLAKDQNTSASEFLREAAKEKLSREDELSQRRRAFENILKHRPKPVKGRIDYKALINEGRKSY